MSKKEKLESFYTKNYKKLLIIPLIILLISLILVGTKFATTGDLFKKDVTLKGGITATIYTNQEINIEKLKQAIPSDSIIRTLTDFSTGKQLGIIIEVSDIKIEQLENIIEKELNIKLTQENYSVEETGPKLGQAFYRQLILAVLLAFLFMGIVVLITFRTIIPSLAVIQAAVTDIVVTLAIINFLNIEISSAGIVAFLLVIGYSIDTDILLTTRVLKKKGQPLFDRMFSSMKTGLTMTITTLIAITTGFLFTTSFVIKEMFMIIMIALIIDIFTTYLTNTGLLMLYCKKKNITWNSKNYSKNGESGF